MKRKNRPSLQRGIMSMMRRTLLICVLGALLSVPVHAQAATSGSFVERMATQIEEVWSIATATLKSVFAGDVFMLAQAIQPPNNVVTDPYTASTEYYNTAYVPVPAATDGVLAINAPLEVTTSLVVSGTTELATTSVTGPLDVRGLRASALTVSGTTRVVQLFASADASISGVLNALGGITTSGANVDLGTGNLYASNVLYGLEAGDYVTISGDPQKPKISVDLNNLEVVTSVNGETGELELVAGDDITIEGLIITNDSTLSSVRSRGGCASCIIDRDVSDYLTIRGGTINDTEIGQVTPATASFTSVQVGSSIATSTLVVYATTSISGAFSVSSATTSQFTGGINVTDGCVSVNGVCLGGASVLTDLGDVVATSSASGDLLQFDGTVWRNVSPASLGIGAISYTDLSDTPATYIAGALAFANATADGMTQSTDLVFDGTGLAIGTSTAYAALTVAGDVQVLEGATRWYNQQGGYVGLRASSTVLSSTEWTLPVSDGLAYQVLFTDGNGNLEFADVSALGGGANRYTQLLDTPSTLTGYAIPYTNASGTALTQSSSFVYTGSYLGVGVAAPTERLSVDGSVRFAGPSGQAGLYYFQGGALLGLGTNSPTDRLSILGGSVTQTGGTAASNYSPIIVGGVSMSDDVTDIDVSGAYAYAVSASPGNDFHVINIKNPAAPVEIASINLVTNARAVAVRGQYAFVGTTLTGNDFHVIDISNPLAPVEVAGINMDSSVNDIVLAGRYAYVVTDSTGNDFHVIDLRDPLAPVEVAALDLPDNANGVAVSGKYAYVVTSVLGNDFHIIDISDPTNPVLKGELNLPDTANKVVVEGGYAYVTTDSAGDDVHVINVRNAAAPTLVGGVNLVTSARGIAISGKYLYVTSLGTSYDFHVIDVENPAAPTLVGQVDPAAGDGLGIKVVGRYAYMTSSSGGNDVHVIDVSGATFQAATIYSISGGTMAVTADANVGGRVYAGLGVVSGVEGVQTDGVLNVLGTGASYFAGSIGIGTTSSTSKLTVDGSIQSTSLLGGATNLTTDANGVIIRDPSDVRLKEHITTIENALDMVLSLRGVRYEWKDKDRFGTQTEIGFIAQEVDPIIPEVVRKGGDYWSINTRNIIAVVVEAIKEIWARVEGNTEKIQSLEARVSELEAELGGDATTSATTTQSVDVEEVSKSTGDMSSAVDDEAESVAATTTAIISGDSGVVAMTTATSTEEVSLEVDTKAATSTPVEVVDTVTDEEVTEVTTTEEEVVVEEDSEEVMPEEIVEEAVVDTLATPEELDVTPVTEDATVSAPVL